MNEDKYFTISLYGFGLRKDWIAKNNEDLEKILLEIKELHPILIKLLDDYNEFKDKLNTLKEKENGNGK